LSLLLAGVLASGIAQATSMGVTPTPHSPADVELRKGMTHAAAGKWDEADKRFEAVLKLAPHRADAYLTLAYVAQKRGKPAEAERHFGKALKVAPGNALVLQAWGHFLTQHKRYAEAERALIEATSRNPLSLDPLLDLGLFYTETLNKPDKALETYRKAVATNRLSWRAHHALSVALRNNGSREEAIQEMEEARRLAPGNSMLAYELGRLYAATRAHEKAAASFDAAVQANASYTLARMARADILRTGLRNYREAVNAYHDLIEIEPRNAPAHYGLGLALKDLGENGNAIEAFQQAARLAPDDPFPLVALSRVYLDENEFERAEELLHAALKLRPSFAQAMVAQADLHLAQGDEEKAVARYNDALKADPNAAPAYVKVGIVYQRRQQWKEAEQAYGEALKRDPNLAAAHNNLAWMAVERDQKLDEALDRALKAVAREPDNPHFQDTLGWIHRLQGDLDKAVDSLLRASKLAPTDTTIWYHLGIVYAERLAQSLALVNVATPYDRVGLLGDLHATNS
jgi:tetratricopeptide (TPR) repeat protein